MTINLTHYDSLMMNHTARVERANREGWLREAALPVGGGRNVGNASVATRTRRHVGLVLVTIGARLQGIPTIQASDRAAVV